MSALLFRGPLVGLVFLVASVQLYAPKSYAKSVFVSKSLSGERLVETVARPVAGRNRRNIALRSSGRSYPRALNDQMMVPSRTNKLRINVLANDSGNRLKIKEVNKQSAKGGRVYIQGSHVVYLPKPGFRGWDSFWYAVIDARGRRHSAKVNVCLCDR